MSDLLSFSFLFGADWFAHNLTVVWEMTVPAHGMSLHRVAHFRITPEKFSAQSTSIYITQGGGGNLLLFFFFLYLGWKSPYHNKPAFSEILKLSQSPKTILRNSLVFSNFEARMQACKPVFWVKFSKEFYSCR